jgi:citrate lyase subunit beta/citryl-CoA lyase
MRSLLFVPADGGSKLEKAMASGTDAVIIDLEDSITPERKTFARKATLEFLKQASATTQRPRLLVRINGLDTGMTDADLDAIVSGRPDAIVFPKAEGATSVVHLDAKLSRKRPSPACRKDTSRTGASSGNGCRTVRRRNTFGGAKGRLIGLTGSEDLRSGIGRDDQRDAHGNLTEPYQLARSSVSMPLRPQSCRRSRPFTLISAIRRIAPRQRNCARRDGFTGARHSPDQVPVIKRCSPTEGEIEKAKAVVPRCRAARRRRGGIEGKMYDRPHLARAQALLALTAAEKVTAGFSSRLLVVCRSRIESLSASRNSR